MDKLFGLLFDSSLKKPATPQLAKMLYVLAVILCAVSGVLMILGGFSKSIVSGVVMLVVAPLSFLVSVCLARIGLETVMAIHRTASYAGELARFSRRGGGDAPAAGDPPPPAAQPAGPAGAGTTRVSMVGRTGF